MKRIRVSPEAFEALVNKQGHAGIKDATFECPSCKKLQTARDFMSTLNTSFEHVKHLFLTRCIGRIDPKKGCNFSFEDYFATHEMEIVYRDGTTAPVFIPRTEEEQRKIRRKLFLDYKIKDVQRLISVDHVHISYISNTYRLTASKTGRLISNTHSERLNKVMVENDLELNSVEFEKKLEQYNKEVGYV